VSRTARCSSLSAKSMPPSSTEASGVVTSSMATSSATRSGWSRRQMPLPRIAILARSVRAASIAAMMFGEGMVP